MRGGIFLRRPWDPAWRILLGNQEIHVALVANVALVACGSGGPRRPGCPCGPGDPGTPGGPCGPWGDEVSFALLTLPSSN